MSAAASCSARCRAALPSAAHRSAPSSFRSSPADERHTPSAPRLHAGASADFAHRSAWDTHLRSFAATSSGTPSSSPALRRHKARWTLPFSSRYGSRRSASSRKRDGLSDITSTVQSGELANWLMLAQFWRTLSLNF